MAHMLYSSCKDPLKTCLIPNPDPSQGAPNPFSRTLIILFKPSWLRLIWLKMRGMVSVGYSPQPITVPEDCNRNCNCSIPLIRILYTTVIGLGL